MMDVQHVVNDFYFRSCTSHRVEHCIRNCRSTKNNHGNFSVLQKVSIVGDVRGLDAHVPKRSLICGLLGPGERKKYHVVLLNKITQNHEHPSAAGVAVRSRNTFITDHDRRSRTFEPDGRGSSLPTYQLGGTFES